MGNNLMMPVYEGWKAVSMEGKARVKGYWGMAETLLGPLLTVCGAVARSWTTLDDSGFVLGSGYPWCETKHRIE
jgi:hypothetical protein